MPINPYFSGAEGESQEQMLLEDLIIESIQINGEDMTYIPRNINNLNSIYGEDDSSSYTKSYTVEMYIKSVDGFTGDGNFMSKFGLEIRDQVTFSVARRTFMSLVGDETGLIRPREGDLVWFPLNQKLFQIKFVNKFEMFYQFGGLQTWEMTCELFEYSNETIETGIPEIDRIGAFDNSKANTSVQTTSPGAINDDIIEQANTIIDWSTSNPFGDESTL
jgi:hypothetical protein